MTSSPSAAVVGAGVCGTATALALRNRGFRVSLFDPGPLPHPDAASTDTSKVVRMDYGSDELYTELMELAFPTWDEWNRDWPEPLYHEDGFLLMSRRPMRPGDFENDSYETLTRRGHTVERIDREALRRRFPAWRTDLYPDGYWNPRAGWAESSRVVARLVDLSEAAGVELHEGARFQRLLESGSRVTGVVTADGAEHRADHVVLAAGAWVPQLLPYLSDVMWATGQPVFHFAPADPGPFQAPNFSVWSADIATTGWYGFPALPDGTIKIGNHGPGVRVDPAAPRRVADGEEERFREFLRGTFPGAADAPVAQTRLCLYCDTFDGDYWIDHDPDRPGLVVAAGDSGHSFKFAPLLGELVADVLERRPNRFAQRFAWRAPSPSEREQARFDG